MKKIKCIKILYFLAILSLAVGYTFYCYSCPKRDVDKSYEAFYDEPKDTIDGVILGTSVVVYGWTPPVAWQEYGMPVYQLGGYVMPFGPLPALIDFVRSRQDIRYVIVDIHGLRTETIQYSVTPAHCLKLSGALHFGLHQYKVISQTIDYAERVYDHYGMPEDPDEAIDPNDLSLYIPFIRFHSRWIEGLQKADYVSVPNNFKGAAGGKRIFKQKDMSDGVSAWEKGPLPLDSFQKETLDGFFSYLQEQDLDVLFINYPSFNTEEEHRQLKGIARYIEDNHYPMLDLCDQKIMDEIGIDLQADFKDISHANSMGAAKMTRYICSYVKDHFYYKDHRGDPRYESWDKAAIDYNAHVEKGWAEKGREFSIIRKDQSAACGSP